MSLFTGRGKTVARWHGARKTDADQENTDHVVGMVQIPPGCTVTNIDMVYDAIGDAGCDRNRAYMSMLHGALITFPGADHGYGGDMGALDNIWDDKVPKDVHQDLALSELTSNSWGDADSDSESSSLDEGAIESGQADGDDAEMQLGNLVGLDSGPEIIFQRIKRHNLNNSPVLEEGKYTPTDHYRGKLRKNYHVPKNRFGMLLFAHGTPKFAADTETNMFSTEQQWLHAMYPELYTMSRVWDHTEQDTTHHERVMEHLEQWYVSQDTWTDIEHASGHDQWTVYLDLTVQYLRPRYDNFTMNAKQKFG